MTIDTFQITKASAVLTPALKLHPVEITPSFYEEIDRDFSGFRDHVLIAQHTFTEDWPTWEKHPKGDEMVMLLGGEGTLVLRTAEGEEAVQLSQPGTYVVVPADTWHTATVTTSASMLFITPGEGTENVEEQDLNANN